MNHLSSISRQQNGKFVLDENFPKLRESQSRIITKVILSNYETTATNLNAFKASVDELDQTKHMTPQAWIEYYEELGIISDRPHIDAAFYLIDKWAIAYPFEALTLYKSVVLQTDEPRDILLTHFLALDSKQSNSPSSKKTYELKCQILRELFNETSKPCNLLIHALSVPDHADKFFTIIENSDNQNLISFFISLFNQDLELLPEEGLKNHFVFLFVHALSHKKYKILSKLISHPFYVEWLKENNSKVSEFLFKPLECILNAEDVTIDSSLLKNILTILELKGCLSYDRNTLMICFIELCLRSKAVHFYHRCFNFINKEIISPDSLQLVKKLLSSLQLANLDKLHGKALSDSPPSLEVLKKLANNLSRSVDTNIDTYIILLLNGYPLNLTIIATIFKRLSPKNSPIVFATAALQLLAKLKKTELTNKNLLPINNSLHRFAINFLTSINNNPNSTFTSLCIWRKFVEILIECDIYQNRYESFFELLHTAYFTCYHITTDSKDILSPIFIYSLIMTLFEKGYKSKVLQKLFDRELASWMNLLNDGMSKEDKSVICPLLSGILNFSNFPNYLENSKITFKDFAIPESEWREKSVVSDILRGNIERINSFDKIDLLKEGLDLTF